LAQRHVEREQKLESLVAGAVVEGEGVGLDPDLGQSGAPQCRAAQT
jgi:hypothetical protein